MFSWVRDAEQATPLADFFVRNVGPEYISHGEILTGRASDEQTWAAAHLFDSVCVELAGCAKSFVEGGNSRAATATQGQRVVGLAICEIDRSTATAHAWVEDIVIDQNARARGFATAFLAWIEEQLEREGVLSVFIESGMRNSAAHVFFERRGYRPCSLVMRKVLRDA